MTPVPHHLGPALAVLGTGRRQRVPELHPEPGLLEDLTPGAVFVATRPARTCPWAGSSRRSAAGARAAPRRCPSPSRRHSTPPAARTSARGHPARGAAAARGPLPRRRPRAAGLVLDDARSIPVSIPATNTSSAVLGCVSAASRSQPAATTASWWSPRTSWSAATALANRWRRLAERGGDGLGRVAAPLGPDAHLVQLLVGRDLGERLDRPGAAASTVVRASGGRTSAAGASASGSSAGSPRRVDEPVEQLRRTGPSAAPRAARRARPPTGAPAERARCSPIRPVGLGEPGDLRPEELEQHLGVAHRAELGTEPLELVPQRLVPLRDEERAERAQVGAEPPGRDARLVHLFGVVAEADAGVVREQAHAPTTAIAAWTTSRAGESRRQLAGRLDVGRRERAHAERRARSSASGSAVPAPGRLQARRRARRRARPARLRRARPRARGSGR